LRDGLPEVISSKDLVGELYPSFAAAGLITESERSAVELPSSVTSERTARRRPPPTRRRRLSEDEVPENPFTHSFEKVHTAEEHKGGSKRADSGDELADHQAALDELELTEVVLSAQRPRSVYQADALFTSTDRAPVGENGALNYDEWDVARRRYLARHCSLTVEEPMPALSSCGDLRQRLVSGERHAIAATRAQLLRLETAQRWHTRQPDGPDVDLDALLDRNAALAAGHEGPARLCASRRRRGTSLSLLVLLDASLSSDSWVANRRVLDVERDAAAILALALDGLPTELAMAAFCSFSRADCRFLPLKGFRETVQTGLARLAQLEPRGYTRIGPALRHGTRILEKTVVQRRALLLLSDGKPTDTDAYEGRHGLGDVRQAVREASQRGVEVFALSVDPRSRPILSQMFDSRSHAAVSAPRDVARAVSSLVTRLSR